MNLCWRACSKSLLVGGKSHERPLNLVFRLRVHERLDRRKGALLTQVTGHFPSCFKTFIQSEGVWRGGLVLFPHKQRFKPRATCTLDEVTLTALLFGIQDGKG